MDTVVKVDVEVEGAVNHLTMRLTLGMILRVGVVVAGPFAAGAVFVIVDIERMSLNRMKYSSALETNPMPRCWWHGRDCDCDLVGDCDCSWG